MRSSQGKAERMLQLQQVCKYSEALYNINPLDAENLTRWGEALVEMAEDEDYLDAKKDIQDAISKLKTAWKLNPVHHKTFWLLGKAHYAYGCLTCGLAAAPQGDLDKACDYFRKALRMENENDLYCRCGEFGDLKSVQAKLGGFSNGQCSKRKSSAIILGWMLFAAGIVAWARMAKSHLPSAAR